MTSDVELAWAAGFFDGEGCVVGVVDKRDMSVRVDITVVQASHDEEPPDTLLRLVDIFGVGQLNARKDNRGRLGNKQIWNWRVGAISEVRAVFEAMRPHLARQKLDQFAVAFALRNEYEGMLSDRRRFCKRGHEFTESNTYFFKNRKAKTGSGLVRLCRTCNADATRRSRLRRRSLSPMAVAEGQGG